MSISSGTFAHELQINTMSNSNEHGHIKIVFCRKSEEKVNVIWKDVAKQFDGEQIPTIIYTTKLDAKEWTKNLIQSAGITTEKAEEDLLQKISGMPLYVSTNQSYDVGYLSWLILRDTEKQKIKRVYIESPEALNVSCSDEESAATGVVAGTILRHLAVSLGVEIILVSNSDIPGAKEKVLEFPTVFIEPNGISDYADEIVYFDNL